MPKRFYYVNDPAFGEYVYNCLINTSKEDILQLDDKERNIFRSKSNMRRFADNEGLEKRLLLLARLKISFCVVCAPLLNQVDKIIEKSLEVHDQPKARVSLMETMARDKIFVTSSREFLMATHLAAHNSHSQVYVLNYDYLQLQRSVSKLKEDVYSKQQKEVEAGFRDLGKFILATLIAEDALEVGAGVTQEQMKILLILFEYPDKFIHSDILARALGETARSRYVLRGCRELMKLGMIEHMPGITQEPGRSSRFTIMEKGIDAVMYYMKFITKKARENKI